MRKISGVLAVCSLALLPAAAFAQQYVSPSEVDQRFENQENRTDQGLKDGQLTSGQAAKFTQGDANKEKELAKFQAKDGKGGQITKWQNAKLNRQLNGESHKIYAERHGN
ncbi:MAG TPA: hypothetical protein VLX09_25845 [Stellaceae bacterium]|nr:hypothetical protein [Stellaceae bacterium]